MKEYIPFFRVYREGKNIKNFFLAGRTITAGRGKGISVSIPSPDLEERHFSIYFDEEKKIWIENISGREETLLNGRRLGRERILPGNVITCGATFIEFMIVDREQVVRLLKTKIEGEKGEDVSISLSLTPPDDEGKEVKIPLKKGIFLIGSRDSHILLRSKDISERHAAIEVMPDFNVYLRDLKSGTGTFLNGIRIDVSILRDGDHFTIGRFRFRFNRHSLAKKGGAGGPAAGEGASKGMEGAPPIMVPPLPRPPAGRFVNVRWLLLLLLVAVFGYYLVFFLKSTDENVVTTSKGRRWAHRGERGAREATPEEREISKGSKKRVKKGGKGWSGKGKKGEETFSKRSRSSSRSLEDLERELEAADGDAYRPMKVWGGDLPPKLSDGGPMEEEIDPYDEFGIPKGAKITYFDFDREGEKGEKGAASGAAAGKAEIKTGEGGKKGGKGWIDQDVVFRVIEDNLVSMRFCYEKEARKNPYLEGKVHLRFTLGTGGKIEKVTFDKKMSTLFDPGINICLENMLMGLTFPAPSGGSVSIPYSFTFQSQL